MVLPFDIDVDLERIREAGDDSGFSFMDGSSSQLDPSGLSSSDALPPASVSSSMRGSSVSRSLSSMSSKDAAQLWNSSPFPVGGFFQDYDDQTATVTTGPIGSLSSLPAASAADILQQQLGPGPGPNSCGPGPCAGGPGCSGSNNGNSGQSPALSLIDNGMTILGGDKNFSNAPGTPMKMEMMDDERNSPMLPSSRGSSMSRTNFTSSGSGNTGGASGSNNGSSMHNPTGAGALFGLPPPPSAASSSSRSVSPAQYHNSHRHNSHNSHSSHPHNSHSHRPSSHHSNSHSHHSHSHSHSHSSHRQPHSHHNAHGSQPYPMPMPLHHSHSQFGGGHSQRYNNGMHALTTAATSQHALAMPPPQNGMPQPNNMASFPGPPHSLASRPPHAHASHSQMHANHGRNSSPFSSSFDNGMGPAVTGVPVPQDFGNMFQSQQTMPDIPMAGTPSRPSTSNAQILSQTPQQKAKQTQKPAKRARTSSNAAGNGAASPKSDSGISTSSADIADPTNDIDMAAASAGGGVLYACTCVIKSKEQCLLHSIAARSAPPSSMRMSDVGAQHAAGPGGDDVRAFDAPAGAMQQAQAPVQSRSGRKKVDYACQNCRNSKVGCDEYLGVNRQCTRCFRLGKMCIRTGRGTQNSGSGTKKTPRRRARRKPGQTTGQKRGRNGAAAVAAASVAPGPAAGAVIVKSEPHKDRAGQHTLVTASKTGGSVPRIQIDTWTVAAGTQNKPVHVLSKARLAEITVSRLAKLLPSVANSAKNAQQLQLLASLCARSVSSVPAVESQIVRQLKPAATVPSPPGSPKQPVAEPPQVDITHDYVKSSHLQQKADEASRLLSALPVGIFHSDYEHSDDGKTCRVYFDYNERVCSIYGYTRDEVQERIVGGYSSLVHHADWEVHLREECEAVMKAPATFESTRQCFVVGKNGRMIQAIKIKRICFNEKALPISRTTLIIPLMLMQNWPSAAQMQNEQQKKGVAASSAGPDLPSDAKIEENTI